jgi:CheY-like chemotaxis protein
VKSCTSTSVRLAVKRSLYEILAGGTAFSVFNISLFLISTYDLLGPKKNTWHDICSTLDKDDTDMVSNLSKLEEVNVLVSDANWAWPEALRRIFRPRGVNLLVAENASEFVHIIEKKRIHTTIVDMDSEQSNGLATIRIIRIEYPLIPCILLTRTAGKSLLGKALQLDVFSVIRKPVDMHILREQLNRLFLKKYGSGIFGGELPIRN